MRAAIFASLGAGPFFGLATGSTISIFRDLPQPAGDAAQPVALSSRLSSQSRGGRVQFGDRVGMRGIDLVEAPAGVGAR